YESCVCGLFLMASAAACGRGAQQQAPPDAQPSAPATDGGTALFAAEARCLVGDGDTNDIFHAGAGNGVILHAIFPIEKTEVEPNGEVWRGTTRQLWSFLCSIRDGRCDTHVSVDLEIADRYGVVRDVDVNSWTAKLTSVKDGVAVIEV